LAAPGELPFDAPRTEPFEEPLDPFDTGLDSDVDVPLSDDPEDDGRRLDEIGLAPGFFCRTAGSGFCPTLGARVRAVSTLRVAFSASSCSIFVYTTRC
jgi:hypothetical protein